MTAPLLDSTKHTDNQIINLQKQIAYRETITPNKRIKNHE
jgi:hypothetical protein